MTVVLGPNGLTPLHGGESRTADGGESRALTRATLPASMLSGDRDQVPTLGPHAAMRVGEVYACVRTLVDAAASLPLQAYRRTEAGHARHDGHLAQLLDRPAAWMTTSSLVGSIMASLQLHGDAFIGLYRDSGGQIAQLGLLDPTTIEVRLEAGELVYLLMTRDGVARLTSRDICHVRAPLPDGTGLRGLSPIRACAQTIGLARGLATHAAQFANSHPRPGILVTLDPKLTMDQVSRDGLREEINEHKSGDILILGGGITGVEAMRLSLVDVEFVAQRVHSAQEVARIFRVPAAMLDLPSGDSLTYATVAEQARSFVRWSLTPWLRAIEEAISGHRELSPATHFVRFNLDAVLAAAPVERAQFYERALADKWMTVAEVRRIEDLPTLPQEVTDA
jgi:HK97 family phage portal protein